MKDERHSVLRVSCPSRSRFLVEFTLSKIPRFFLFAPLRVRMTSEEPALSEAKGLGMTRPEQVFQQSLDHRVSAFPLHPLTFLLPLRPLTFFLTLLVAPCRAPAQDNYEIQVYSYDTVEPGHTMVELHSNFTFEGSKTRQDGVLPTEHAWHETVEITRGFTPWFETGFYIFTSARNGNGWDWVGDHIRPRFRIPETWHWPVGVSVSNEIGYQRPIFSVDTWTWEIRPIIDKKQGRWYWSFNPTVDRAFHGPSVKKGFEFSPNFKFSYDLSPKIAAGLEYYSSLGPVTGFDPLKDQQQQIFPTVDLNLSPKWEFNFGVGVGMTRSTDHLIAKMILGYRFDF